MAAKKNYHAVPYNRGPNPLQTGLTKVFPWLLGPMLFFAVLCWSRMYAVVLAALFLLFTLGGARLPVLRERISPLSLSVLLYATVSLLSGLWSHFGESAGQESAKILIALAMFGLVLFRVEKEKTRGLLHTTHGVLTLTALLCLDGSGSLLLVKALDFVSGIFQFSIDPAAVGYEYGVRITGIFGNGNVSGGVLAASLLVGLYLFRTAASRKEQLLVAAGLGVEALAFFLSFSMGSMAAFAVACVTYILCSPRGEKFSLFLLMLECVVFTILGSFVAFPLLGGSTAQGILLWFIGPVVGLLVWALDTFVAVRIVKLLEGKTRILSIAAGALAVAAVAFVALAFRMTGGITLQQDKWIERAVNPGPGSYTVAFEGVDAQVRVYTQNEADLMMHTETTLYQGPLSQAAFTVPEDSKVVWFQLSGEGDLHSVTLSDGTALPLGYKLLPAFAANRLQALWANQNFIQRFVFFRDGLKLWLESPLLGWGLGGVEGQVMAVQSFYYESKYVHNHFIQMLAEAGIPGLLSFLLVLGSAAWLLLRKRKSGNPLLPVMAAVLALILVHSLVEVVWSAQSYQVVVFTLLAVLAIEFWEPLPLFSSKRFGLTTAAVLWCVVLVFGAFQCGNRLAAAKMEDMDVRQMSVQEFIAAAKQLDTLEVYDDLDHKANLMLQMLETGNLPDAARYARQLRSLEEYDSAYYVSAYYYVPLRDIPSMFDAMQTGVLQERSNAAAWNGAFNSFTQCVTMLEPEYMPALVEGIVETGRLLEEANAELMAPIALEPQNQSLLDTAITLQGADAQMIHTTLSAMFAG